MHPWHCFKFRPCLNTRQGYPGHKSLGPGYVDPLTWGQILSAYYPPPSPFSLPTYLSLSSFLTKFAISLPSLVPPPFYFIFLYLCITCEPSYVFSPDLSFESQTENMLEPGGSALSLSLSFPYYFLFSPFLPSNIFHSAYLTFFLHFPVFTSFFPIFSLSISLIHSFLFYFFQSFTFSFCFLQTLFFCLFSLKKTFVFLISYERSIISPPSVTSCTIFP